MSSVSSIKVSLANEAIWRDFYPQTEMIVTKIKGRVLFPHLDFNITGLQKDSFYTLHMHLERTDNIKYKFEDGEWKEADKGDAPLPIQYTEHPDGMRNGEHWMSKPVSFVTLKITNDPKNENSNLVLVQSMHKFRPVLTITRYGEPKGEEFREELTEFIVVTSYHNVECKNKKVKHNKRASGFREDGKKGKKRPSEKAEHETPKRPSPCSSTSSSSSSSSSPNISNQSHNFGTPPNPSNQNFSFGSTHASPPPNTLYQNLNIGTHPSPAQFMPQSIAYPNSFYNFSASSDPQNLQNASWNQSFVNPAVCYPQQQYSANMWNPTQPAHQIPVQPYMSNTYNTFYNP